MPPGFSMKLTELKLMMEPPPAAIMSSFTACAQKNWWRRLVAIRSSQYSGVTSSIAWRSSRAALLTSTVNAPPSSPRSRSIAA